eukprot:3728453-Alexandrium_andersonii.AAC.1
MERIRRRLKLVAPAYFDPLKPWGTIFQKACSPSDPETQAYWTWEVINKALLFVTQVRKPADLAAEGTALELNAKRSGHVSVEQVQRETGYGSPKPKPSRENKGKGSPESKSSHVEFLQDQDYCFGWNKGERKDICPNSRVRKCIFCGGGHRLRGCPTAPAHAVAAFRRFQDYVSKGSSKGNRKGKGRGKGEGK